MKALLNRKLSEQEKNTIDDFVSNLQRRLGRRLMRIIFFGSRARGEPGPDSDIDIAVIIDQVDHETRKLIRDIAMESWLKHGLFVSTRVWDQAHWERMRSLQTGLYRNLVKEGVVLE